MNQKLKEKIFELETDLLRPETRKSAERLNELLVDNFIEFGSSGKIYDKKNIIERLPSSISPKYKISDFQIRELADDVILATYKTNKQEEDSEKNLSLRSSIWKKNQGQWQMEFHQGTPEA
ncbi:MAG: DUF4440 domain-containing protein [Candidatus Buchananbacteria bacterium]|nr:DUF4440 domain-containing protein [Candidatus Buchananbacteria bacterium]